MTANKSIHGISVIMPVHNGGQYLDTAVSSILNQTFKNIELILIDDHSTDSSITKLELSDARIRLVKNPGRGIVSALNHGIEQARMPFIARMDADDIALPERLQRQMDYLLNQTDIKICSTQVEIFRENGELGGGYQHYQHWINTLTAADEIATNMFIESPVPHPTVMMRKKDLENLGGYSDNGCPEDYELWLRAHLQGYRFGKPEGILLRWRDHDSRLSRNSLRYSKKAFFKTKTYHLTRLYPDVKFRIWGSGPTGGLLFDEILNNSGTVVDFIDVAPKRIGNSKRNKPIVDAYQIEKTKGLILVAVSARGARQDIRDFLNQRGFIETINYICVA